MLDRFKRVPVFGTVMCSSSIVSRADDRVKDETLVKTFLDSFRNVVTSVFGCFTFEVTEDDQDGRPLPFDIGSITQCASACSVRVVGWRLLLVSQSCASG